MFQQILGKYAVLRTLPLYRLHPTYARSGSIYVDDVACRYQHQDRVLEVQAFEMNGRDIIFKHQVLCAGAHVPSL
jgi:hypothetical protein